MKKVLFVILILGIGIQFIPVSKNQGDVVPKTDFLQSIEAPITVQRMIKASCYDCHSNNTNYRWYGRVRPFVWFLEKHINEGKAELNFSIFQEYSDRMKSEKIRSMISQIEKKQMPLEEYAAVHNEARLDEAERDVLIEYLKSTSY